MTRTVGQVAEDFGLTVRTLHHYDAIGLLRPSARTSAGYRLYTEADLARLQHIVVYRRLELPLEEIAELLREGSPVRHLRRQRERVMARLDEMRELVAAIDNALEKTVNDQPMTPADMRELFGENFDDYQDEAEQKWGETDAWRESQRRAAGYTKADWATIKEESDTLQAAFVAACRDGVPADSGAAMDAAEAHRQHIGRWFYDCPPAFHRNLGELYVSDPRYIENYDGSADLPGLALYVRDAIAANADRQEAAG